MEKYYNREYKATLFSLIFGENKENLLDLFNALNGTSYGNAEEIEYTTLESDRGFFLRLKNDLSFIIDRTLGVYEHQSTTTSANIALRLLHYYSDLMRKMIDGKLLYRARMVKIPAPQFIVFYNGRNEQADEVIFHLSDLFERRVDTPEIELKVRMININDGRNAELLEKCSSLAQYARFVCRMRNALDNIQDKDQRWKAASDVISDSINDGILPDVLQRYRSEVIEMYYWEYDEEAHRWAIEQDAIEKGHEEGFQKGQQEGFQKGQQEGFQKGQQEGFQKGQQEGFQKGQQKGIKEGIKEGINNGRLLEQIRLVTKKVRKGKDFSVIVEDLESDEAGLRPIWNAVNAEAPSYDEQKILDRIIPESSAD